MLRRTGLDVVPIAELPLLLRIGLLLLGQGQSQTGSPTVVLELVRACLVNEIFIMLINCLFVGVKCVADFERFERVIQFLQRRAGAGGLRGRGCSNPFAIVPRRVAVVVVGVVLIDARVCVQRIERSESFKLNQV